MTVVGPLTMSKETFPRVLSPTGTSPDPRPSSTVIDSSASCPAASFALKYIGFEDVDPFSVCQSTSSTRYPPWSASDANAPVESCFLYLADMIVIRATSPLPMSARNGVPTVATFAPEAPSASLLSSEPLPPALLSLALDAASLAAPATAATDTTLTAML